MVASIYLKKKEWLPVRLHVRAAETRCGRSNMGQCLRCLFLLGICQHHISSRGSSQVQLCVLCILVAPWWKWSDIFLLPPSASFPSCLGTCHTVGTPPGPPSQNARPGPAQEFAACGWNGIVPPPGLPESQCRFRAVSAAAPTHCMSDFFEATVKSDGESDYRPVRSDGLRVSRAHCRIYQSGAPGSFLLSPLFPYFLHFAASPGSCNHPKDIWQLRNVSWSETFHFSFRLKCLCACFGDFEPSNLVLSGR